MDTAKQGVKDAPRLSGRSEEKRKGREKNKGEDEGLKEDEVRERSECESDATNMREQLF